MYEGQAPVPVRYINSRSQRTASWPFDSQKCSISLAFLNATRDQFSQNAKTRKLVLRLAKMLLSSHFLTLAQDQFSHSRKLVGEEGIEPSQFIQPKDFKSFASASSAIRPAFYQETLPTQINFNEHMIYAPGGSVNYSAN